MASEIEGMDALLKQLSELEGLHQRRALRSGVTKAAAVVRKKARENAKGLDDSKTEEQIFRNVNAKAWRMRKNRPYLGSSVGVLGGAKSPATGVGEIQGKGKDNPGGDTWYWRLLEFGTARTAAKPFLSTALTSEEKKAIAAMKDGAEKAIQSILTKSK